MKERIWPFVLGNNLIPVALIVLLTFAYLKYAPPTPPALTKPTVPQTASPPKYVEKIIEKHYYTNIGEGGRFFYLPKEELEKERPGSVSPEVLHDNNSQVVARTEIPPHKGNTQIDAIRKQDDTGVARFHIDYRQLPPPFFSLKREIHGGIYYGLTGENILEGEVKINPLRIGPVETAIKARVGLEREDNRFNGQLLLGVEY